MTHQRTREQERREQHNLGTRLYIRDMHVQVDSPTLGVLLGVKFMEEDRPTGHSEKGFP